MQETTPQTAALTPTEAVLLQPERFAPKDTVFTAGFEPVLGGEKVALAPLAETLLAVALLANERAGAIRLEIRPKKTLFGLRTVRPLVAEATGRGGGWPAGTLEAAVLEALAGGAREAYDVLHAVFHTDKPNPASWVTVLVMQGLHARGLMDAREKKALKLFTVTELTATPQLEGVVRAHGSAAEEALLREALQRNEEWNALRKAASGAISARTESRDD